MTFIFGKLAHITSSLEIRFVKFPRKVLKKRRLVKVRFDLRNPNMEILLGFSFLYFITCVCMLQLC